MFWFVLPQVFLKMKQSSRRNHLQKLQGVLNATIRRHIWSNLFILHGKQAGDAESKCLKLQHSRGKRLNLKIRLYVNGGSKKLFCNCCLNIFVVLSISFATYKFATIIYILEYQDCFVHFLCCLLINVIANWCWFISPIM